MCNMSCIDKWACSFLWQRATLLAIFDQSLTIIVLTGSSGYHLDNSMDPDTALRKIQTSGSISISPELFEKIYLSPQNKVSGDLRKTFGNPTPL